MYAGENGRQYEAEDDARRQVGGVQEVEVTRLGGCRVQVDPLRATARGGCSWGWTRTHQGQSGTTGGDFDYIYYYSWGSLFWGSDWICKGSHKVASRAAAREATEDHVHFEAAGLDVQVRAAR